MTLAPPAFLGGRYRLDDVIGRGGMSTVYGGIDTRLGRPVAVKIMRAELTADTSFLSRFEREARAAARLSHPNVVAVYDTGDEDGIPFIVMERLPGGSLADRLKEGPLSPGPAVGIALDLLAALSAAHRSGLVHRDIKPANVLFAEDGSAKVSDFGIAKTLEEAAAGDSTAVHLVVGTPAYISPERLEGQPAAPRADIWSVGVVLYECLTGRRPFASNGSAMDIARAVLYADLHTAEDLRAAGIPGALASVIDRAMSRDPERRFESAAAMATALSAVDTRAPLGQDAVAEPATTLLVSGAEPGASALTEEEAPTAVLSAPPAAPATAVPPAPSATASGSESDAGALSSDHQRPHPLTAALAAAVVLFCLLWGGHRQGPASPATANLPATTPSTATTMAVTTTLPATAPPPAPAHKGPGHKHGGG